MRLEEAIKQTSFKTPYQKAHLNLIFTASWLNHRTSEKLKPFGISIQQFNILRILKGRKGEPATVKLLTERMIDKMSNASRLVDKLVAKGYVERKTCEADRRRVDVYITDPGSKLIETASTTIDDQFSSEMSLKLSDEEFETLSNLLDRMRI